MLSFIRWILPTMATQGVDSVFPLLHAERFLFSTFSHATKEKADICMQAWRIVTNKNCLPQTLSLMLIDGLTLLYNWHFIIGTIMLWNLGPFCTSSQTWNLKLWNNSELKTVWWQFCFCKIDSHWKLFTINRPSHLST